MGDHLLDFPGGDSLEVRLENNALQGSLDPGVPLEYPGDERDLPRYWFIEGDIAIPGPEGSSPDSIPVGYLRPCSLIPGCPGLLYRFLIHHLIQEPGDDLLQLLDTGVLLNLHHVVYTVEEILAPSSISFSILLGFC